VNVAGGLAVAPAVSVGCTVAVAEVCAVAVNVAVAAATVSAVVVYAGDRAMANGLAVASAVVGERMAAVGSDGIAGRRIARKLR